jgi:hypothetical protein
MNIYGAGTRLFCDFVFGGKPKAVCLEVIKPGSGRSSEGKIKVKLLETIGAYKKGEVLIIKSIVAVPEKQEFRKPGSFYRWINTNYQWAHLTKNKTKDKLIRVV